MASGTNYYYYAAAAATAIAGILHLVLAANLIVRGPLFGIFFLIAGIAQLFWALPMAKRWGKMWYYVGIAGTIVLIIIFFVTRVPNPITGGRAFIFIGLTVFILTRQQRLTDNQKEQLK